jgi:hypothetical protein
VYQPSNPWGGKFAVLLGPFMGNDAATWGPDVEDTMDLGPCGELGVQAGSAKKVQGDFRPGDQMVPKMDREVLIHAAEGFDEMVLLKGTLSMIKGELQ